MVSEAGLEPARPRVGDFESPMSANFITLALKVENGVGCGG